MMKNTSLMMLISISLPSKLFRTAIAGSSTIMRMATRSCIISTTAVVESRGVNWSYPDLGKGLDAYQNIALNGKEDSWQEMRDVNGYLTYNPKTGNGIDNDNNGLIDDFIGWNYDSMSSDCRTTQTHGTEVSNIIAAKTNNNYGIAGIAGGNQGAGIRILPYLVSKDSIIGLAIMDAVNKGAKIINLSRRALFHRILERLQHGA